ncbi:hypothetical protein LRS10_21610 [Phenylobacterium sp. J426]|uniref:hypothetical protein n=1 Tax=Phenylobacterium sp. J426 TaxID=2898439 RepID=UPI002150DF75|nr:hypothetical protein [Phenylobacterium sp. J426]MCR5876510.1 hypothetical protein [Phenylobacterium sp. J426]
MARSPKRTPDAGSTFSLKLGRWFEANASGWGVLAAPIVVLLLVGAALLRDLI